MRRKKIWGGGEGEEKGKNGRRVKGERGERETKERGKRRRGLQHHQSR